MTLLLLMSIRLHLPRQPPIRPGVFSFLYLKKSKFQKYMSVLKYFKTTPGRPMGGRQALSAIFFLQICNEVPGKKNRSLSPP